MRNLSGHLAADVPDFVKSRGVQGRPIGRSFSIYLDLLRFLAAATVMLSHASYAGIADAILPDLMRIGADAVTVFFVMSGFVIAHTTSTKEHTFSDYIVSRLARLWSVAIPALALSLALSYGNLVHHDNAILLKTVQNSYCGQEWIYGIIGNSALANFILGSMFLNEAWCLRIVEFANPVYWSLSYEFCYYILFGAYFYFSKNTRWLLIAAISALFGPKILWLFPIWLMGVGLYKWGECRSRRASYILFISPIVIYSACLYFEINRLSWWFDRYMPFEPSWNRWFVWQYFLGALTFIHLIGARGLGDVPSWLAAERLIRGLAARTLTIYLFHFPILCVMAALAPANWPGMLRGLAILILTSAAIYLIAFATEFQKGLWRMALRAAMRVVSGRLRIHTHPSSRP